MVELRRSVRNGPRRLLPELEGAERLERWLRTGPALLPHLWNALPFRKAEVDAAVALASLRAFTPALPLLFSHLPHLPFRS